MIIRNIGEKIMTNEVKMLAEIFLLIVGIFLYKEDEMGCLYAIGVIMTIVFVSFLF
jgi:hypothetical protein